MKKEKRKLNRESDELKPLGSELGSFGLEPPKIYRNNQRTNANRPEQSQRTQQGKGRKPAPSTRSQKQPQKPKQLTRAELNKKRQQKKKLRLAISIICIILGLVVVMGVLSVTVLFKIDKINVSGNEKYNTKQVLAVLPIETQKNLLICDTDGASEKLKKNLPYIYNVEIERKLPSTLNVKITETPFVYSVKNKDKTYTLLDDRFKVLEPSVAKLPQKTIVIDKAVLTSNIAGEQATFSKKRVKKNLEAMTKAIAELKLDNITSIYSVDVNNNYLVYNDKITIKIGTTSDIDSKLYSAFAALEKIVQSNPDASGELTSMGGKQVYFTEAK